jgi:hypothetical protein
MRAGRVVNTVLASECLNQIPVRGSKKGFCFSEFCSRQDDWPQPRGDVPASKGAFSFKALAPPQADRFSRESRRHALGLLVGMGLDVAPMRCDDGEPRMRAVIFQSFDEFVVDFGVRVVEGGMRCL